MQTAPERGWGDAKDIKPGLRGRPKGWEGAKGPEAGLSVVPKASKQGWGGGGEAEKGVKTGLGGCQGPRSGSGGRGGGRAVPLLGPGRGRCPRGWGCGASPPQPFTCRHRSQRQQHPRRHPGWVVVVGGGERDGTRHGQPGVGAPVSPCPARPRPVWA